MELSAQVSGDFAALIRAEVLSAEQAVTSAMAEATDGLKAELRGQIVGAGLGERLARTWRSKLYPPNEPSLKPAGFLWSKAPDLVSLYEEGAIIRSRHGLFLAIPLPAAGKTADGRKKITPLGWERRTGQRLRFVYRRRGVSLLVADNVRLDSRGKAAPGAVRRKGAVYTRLAGRTTVPVFVLVPQIAVRKRLDVAGAADRWGARLPGLLARRLENTPS